MTRKFNTLRLQYHIKLELVVFLGFSFFFLSIFDSIMSYIVPIVMTDSGLSEFHMGLLYASSSLFGLVFDFLLAKLLRTSNYQRTYIVVLIAAVLFPICMLLNPTLVPFLLGMIIWALYYNLWSFTSADFTARESKVAYHVASVALLFFFHDIGYIIGNLSAEKLLAIFSYTQLMYLMISFALISFFLFMPLVFKKKIIASERQALVEKEKSSKGSEIQRLLLVSKRLLPLLILGVTATTMEAITWTITPIIDRIFPALENLGGVVLAINFLPSFFAYGIASSLTSHFGKKKVGILTFILGSISLAGLGFATTVAAYFLISFVSSFFISIFVAAIGGAFADYLKESSSYDSEIISTRDMFSNLGYIIGPICGGALLSLFNSTILFAYVGIIGAIIGVIVYFITPEKIPFYDKKVDD